MYYGKTDRNCDCPYKAVLEACDQTGSVCVVLWNSVCVRWYRCLKPGDIVSLRRYRVKHHYQAESNDIEISVNSRNPAAQICVLPLSTVSPGHVPPVPTYRFYNSKELLGRPHDDICDVIGLLIFAGRSERIRRQDWRGVELLEYRWLRLEDWASSQPIMVKLFSSSQPETYNRLHPLSVLVLTGLKVIRAPDRSHSFFLTNTTFTQVYCTGLGHHTKMSYRTLRPVQRFSQWLKGQDDQWALSRALIGGFFIFPPPPVSLETFMKERRGEPGFLQGAELQGEMERLCYRERRSFCVQAAVTMVTYSRRGEDHQALVWTEGAPSPCTSSSSPSPRLHRVSPHPFSSLPSPRLRQVSPHPSASPAPSLSLSTSSLLSDPSTPRSFRPVLSSSPLPSPSSSVCPLTPRSLDRRTFRKSWKRKLLQPSDTPKKRHPRVTLQPEQKNKTEITFNASMEFMNNNTDEVEEEDEDGDDEDTLAFITAPPLPAIPPVALETLPMRYDHAHREEQAAAVSLGGNVAAVANFDSPVEAYFTLRLRTLSDGTQVDAIFLPHSPSSPLSPPLHHHCNTWSSILSHGAFSPHAPPPSPADLIAMAAQLANQRLVCVLEACHLGGVKTELILSRAYHLIS
ncbi:RPA-related protein RADX [Xyrichtys novacula]|nr:RPA-related protein RADX [Xyrichtys novacula]